MFGLLDRTPVAYRAVVDGRVAAPVFGLFARVLVAVVGLRTVAPFFKSGRRACDDG